MLFLKKKIEKLNFNLNNLYQESFYRNFLKKEKI